MFWALFWIHMVVLIFARGIGLHTMTPCLEYVWIPMYISQSRSLIFASPRAFISNARAASHLQGGEATILGSNHFFAHVGAILNLRS